MAIPTVLVVLRESGDQMRINASRFDPALHKLVDKADAERVKVASDAAVSEAQAEAEITAQREATSVARRRSAAQQAEKK